MANPKGNIKNLKRGGTIGHDGSNAGRPADWLKAKCQKIIEKRKLIEFLADVADGKDVEQKINENGEVLRIPADVKDRLRALEMLLDRGYGKPAQQFESDTLNNIARTFLVRASEK